MIRNAASAVPRLVSQEKYIIAIFAIGLAIRLLGTFPGYPLIHPDEPSIQTPSIRMAFELNFKPNTYYYGQLLPLIYALAYILFFVPLTGLLLLPVYLLKLQGNLIDFPFYLWEFLHKSVPLHQIGFWDVIYWSRYNSAILSSLTVIAVYILGKRLFNRQIGLTAAFLSAINYRHVLSSKLVLADAPAALFATLALILFIRLLKSRSFKNYVLAGVGVGLALSIKYFVYVIPSFFLCHLFAILKEKRVSIIKRFLNMLFSYKVLFALAFAVILFIAINPYLLLAREEAATQWAANSARYGLHLSLDVLKSGNLSYYSLYYLYHYGLGPVLFITTIVGFIWSFVRYPKGAMIISSAVIPFLYAFLVISGTGMVRNYAAIIPLLLFFPAIFIYDIGKSLPKFKNIGYLVLLTLIGFQSFQYSFLGSLQLAKEQNMIALHKWMEENITDGSKILGPSGIYYPGGKNLEAVRIYLDGNNLPSLEELQVQEVRWLVLETTLRSTTENLLYNKAIVKKLFFNQDQRDTLTTNLYNNLVFQELADYRIAEFSKEFSQDPSYMVVYLPDFSGVITKENELAKSSFETQEEIKNWSYEYFPTSSFNYSRSSESGVNKSGAILVNQDTHQCLSVFSKFTSPLIPVVSKNWYSLYVQGKREFNPAFKTTRNGFFRLDFFNKKDKLIKTYVTRPLAAQDTWQNLHASGMAPETSTYVKITFEIDSCLAGEKYTFDDVTLFETDKMPEVDQEQYPFYMKELPKGFYWVPQL